MPRVIHATIDVDGEIAHSSGSPTGALRKFVLSDHVTTSAQHEARRNRFAAAKLFCPQRVAPTLRHRDVRCHEFRAP